MIEPDRGLVEAWDTAIELKDRGLEVSVASVQLRSRLFPTILESVNSIVRMSNPTG